MLTMTAGPYEVTVAKDPTYTVGSADNLRSYDRAYHLGPDSYVTSRLSVRVTDDGRPVASCILTAGGGASGVHERAAMIIGPTCLVAVGPLVASLALPSLKLGWSTQTDDATCFGIYWSNAHRCLISHGELLITRLTSGGDIEWQAGGADIFTNGFTLHEDSVEAIDFADRRYRFEIETGSEIPI